MIVPASSAKDSPPAVRSATPGTDMSPPGSGAAAARGGSRPHWPGHGAWPLGSDPRDPQGSRQVGSTADAEPAVGVAEVPLDALDADEQSIGDLPVALTRSGELGDA